MGSQRESGSQSLQFEHKLEHFVVKHHNLSLAQSAWRSYNSRVTEQSFSHHAMRVERAIRIERMIRVERMILSEH